MDTLLHNRSHTRAASAACFDCALTHSFLLVFRRARGFPRAVYIIKRNGQREDMLLDKITSRIKKLCYGLDKKYIDPAAITLKVRLPPPTPVALRGSLPVGLLPNRQARSARLCRAGHLQRDSLTKPNDPSVRSRGWVASSLSPPSGALPA